MKIFAIIALSFAIVLAIPATIQNVKYLQGDQFNIQFIINSHENGTGTLVRIVKDNVGQRGKVDVSVNGQWNIAIVYEQGFQYIYVKDEDEQNGVGCRKADFQFPPRTTGQYVETTPHGAHLVNIFQTPDQTQQWFMDSFSGLLVAIQKTVSGHDPIYWEVLQASNSAYDYEFQRPSLKCVDVTPEVVNEHLEKSGQLIFNPIF